MTVPMIMAVVKGYEDRLFDIQIPAIISGYYSGYYMGAKRPKSPDKVISEMISKRQRAQKPQDTKASMDAKVAQFQEREERLRRFLDGRQ